MNTEPKTLLQVENLSVSFGQGQALQQVVHDVSFSINSGQTLAIVGESGSGKSVTAMALVGLLPKPTAKVTATGLNFDNVKFDVNDASALRTLRGKRIAVIFQEPMSALNPLHTVKQQIAEVLILHKPELSADAIHKRCIKLLNRVDLDSPEERLKQYPHELSGGMRQRVMIAMAIAAEPQLLIADEPTTALDVTVQREIMDLLQRLQKNLGMSMLLISHDLPLVRHYAQSIAVMHNGRMIERNDTEALFQQPQQAYTQTLLDADCKGEAVDHKLSFDCLSVESLSVKFPLKKGFWGQTQTWLKAVDDVSFTLKKGETLGIVGESGSGKSTLIKALLRLESSDGEIVFDGQRMDVLHGKRLQPMRKRMQVVLQDPFGSLSPRLTVGAIVREGLDIHTHYSSDEKKRRVAAALHDVNLDPETMSRYPHEFSGGQRQRIAIAKALVMEPEVMVLDEPTSALDRSIQVQVVDLLKNLQKKYQLSYLFISHDLHVVKAISHRVAVMRGGRLIEIADTQALFQSPQDDYTKMLLAASF